MNNNIKRAIDNLKQTIGELERMDSSYWNVSLGTSHLKAYAEEIVNEAKTLAAHLKSYGKRN